MRRENKKKCFIVSGIIAVLSFFLPQFVRTLFQKGIVPENITVMIVMLSMPIAFFAFVFSISCLIAFLGAKKEMS